MKFNEAKKILKDMEMVEKTIANMVNTMGIYAINHYKKSFIDTGFTDENWEPWKRRKNKDSKRGRQFRYERHQGTDEEEGKKFKVKTVDVRSVKNRAILTKTGNLKRSLKYRRIDKYSVRIESNVPYANVHNEGLKSGRGRGFTMPKRQFVGYSGQLSRKIELRLRANIEKIFK